METLKKAVWLPSLLLAGILMSGCSNSKRIESTEVPAQPMANEKVAVAPKAAEPLNHYLVQRHDCLWSIAGRSEIYGDSFQWPLIYKANRDEIKDPDLIYPKQDWRVNKGFSLEERNHARQMAMSTPVYVPHTKPRETLPVDYF